MQSRFALEIAPQFLFVLLYIAFLLFCPLLGTGLERFHFIAFLLIYDLLGKTVRIQFFSGAPPGRCGVTLTDQECCHSLVWLGC